jgi:hypothetical protein
LQNGYTVDALHPERLTDRRATQLRKILDG